MKYIFISQGQIESTLAYITTVITETTHTNIHSLEHSTTWDGLAQIKLDLTTPTNIILLDEILCLLCLHYDLPMYIKCESHLDYIQQ